MKKHTAILLIYAVTVAGAACASLIVNAVFELALDEPAYVPLLSSVIFAAISVPLLIGVGGK